MERHHVRDRRSPGTLGRRDKRKTLGRAAISGCYTARSNQFQITDDYEICSKDLFPFAKSQGWIGDDVTKINFRAVYGTTILYPESNDDIASRPAAETLYNTEMRYQRAMELLKGISGNISAQTLMPCARDHYDTYTLSSGKVLKLNQIPYYSSDYVNDRQEWVTEFPTKDTVEVSVFPRAICHHAAGIRLLHNVPRRHQKRVRSL